MPRVLHRRAVMAGAALLAAPALAQPGWRPDQPVRLLVGFAPGGAVDTVARLIAPGMAAVLGQSVLVENRAGAGANLAAEAVARSAPNGLTLLLGAFAHGVNPELMRLSYDPLVDLAPVTQVSQVPTLMLASPAAPFRSVAEAVAFARANPGRLTYASGGVGTTSHLAPEMLAHRAGVSFTHVPYRGGAPAMQAVLAGDVMMFFDNPQPATRGAVEEGRLRGLAVMQDTRLPDYPAVPAIVEAGLGGDLTVQSWHGVFARGGTPAPLIAALHAAVLAAIADPTIRARIEALSITLVGAGPEVFAGFYAGEITRWAGVVRAAGIRAE
jgi:tripartite-type tricarboxylate transporter receptor subunit TctC